VFGKPVDFGDMLDGAPSPRLHRQISEHALDALRATCATEDEFRRDARELLGVEVE
jgi:hypothetical protein